MAQRRMISLEVIDTDAFLDMGQGSQLLYFHLNSRADDDGFVANPKKIMRSIGAPEDDYKVLLAKKFLIAFNDGVCVIKHWRINNFVRKDIYKETQYLNLKSTLFIRPNGAYTLTDDCMSVKIPQGHFQLESVNESLTTRQLRIGKVSVGKVSVGKDTDTRDFFLEFWEKYPKKVGKGEALRIWKKLRPSNELSERIIASVVAHISDAQWKKESGRFIPNPATFLNQGRYDDELTTTIVANKYSKYAST